jgi:predicted transcriptional regulator
MATQRDRPRSETAYIRRLVDAGLTDFLVLEKEAAESVLTDRRLELLERIRDGNDESVTELADSLGRDKAAVSRDLDVLFENALIEFEQDGRRKIPVLRHETVLIEPIL